MEQQKYWTQSVETLLANLKSTADGISGDDAAQRLEQYGANSLKTGRRDTPLRLFLNQFRSPIVLILIFATIMSALLGDWIDAVIISVIVLASALLSFVQELQRRKCRREADGNRPGHRDGFTGCTKPIGADRKCGSR